MRSVAPERPGSAASQKSWSVVNGKPMAGSRTTTTLQTIQTAKERNSAGMEIQRFRVAMALPGRLPRSPVLRVPDGRGRGASRARRRARRARCGRGSRRPPGTAATGSRAAPTSAWTRREKGRSARSTKALTRVELRERREHRREVHPRGERERASASQGAAVWRYQTEPQRSVRATQVPGRDLREEEREHEPVHPGRHDAEARARGAPDDEERDREGGPEAERDARSSRAPRGGAGRRAGRPRRPGATAATRCAGEDEQDGVVPRHRSPEEDALLEELRGAGAERRRDAVAGRDAHARRPRAPRRGRRRRGRARSWQHLHRARRGARRERLDRLDRRRDGVGPGVPRLLERGEHLLQRGGEPVGDAGRRRDVAGDRRRDEAQHLRDVVGQLGAGRRAPRPAAARAGRRGGRSARGSRRRAGRPTYGLQTGARSKAAV